METPRLSPSIAKILLDKSPKHAWLAHRLLGGQSKKPTPALLKGDAVDKLVFGGAVPDLTKAAKEEAEAIAGSVKDELQRRGIVGLAQHRMEWTSSGIECSGVIDLVDFDSCAFWELKTSFDLSDYNVVKQIENYRYDLQFAAYVDGFTALHPEITAQPTGQFIFVETSAPYDVRFVTMTEQMYRRGKEAWEEAKVKWQQCLVSDMWPGRGDFTADVSAYRKKVEAEAWINSNE